MNHEFFFHEVIKKPLNRLLVQLSRSNINLLADGSYENTSQIVQKILKSTYFQVSVENRNDSYDCHARFKCVINNGAPLNFWSSQPLCLAPITNEDYFYCRGNLSEATRGRYDEIIPSRDYSNYSYKWKHLYYREHADEVLGLVLKNLSEKSFQHQKHRIHLFGFLEDQQRSYTQLLSSNALIKLCADTAAFSKMCKSEGFEFFALSLNYISKASKSNERDINRLDISKFDQKIKYNGEQSRHEASKTYAIFVDSLDSSVFENEEYLENLPSLKKLFNTSLFFKNFTSSGFWTFPCLHSTQTGISPKYTSSFLRIDPFSKLNLKHNNSVPGSSKNVYDVFCLCSYALSDMKNNSLTHIIREAGLKTTSIKSSSLTSHYWNLQEGVNVSIENSTIDLIPHHLKQIREIFEEDIDVIFIDIDTLHRGPLFYKKEGVNWGVDELDFIHKKQSKENRLLGIRDKSFDELARELSQLKKVDMILKEVLEQTSEQDTIVLFSDNGSQNQPRTIPEAVQFVRDSSGTIEKIWRPTLLVRSNKLTEKSGTQLELVSTSDIFSIILHACNLESRVDFNDIYLDSMLPPSLGGKETRKVAETFGLNTKNHLLIEWVKRYGHAQGEYRAINIQGKPLKPIYQLINDLETEFS